MVRPRAYRPSQTEGLPLDRIGFRNLLRRSTAKFLTALGVPLLLLIGLVLYLRAASQELDRSDRVIVEANQVEKLLVTMNAGFRDFGLVTDSRLRAAYLSAERQLDRPLRVLDQSVAPNAAQHRTWLELKAETGEWVRTTDAALAHLLAGASVDSQRTAVLGGRATYSAALAHAQQLIEEEERLRSARNTAISRVVNTMMAIFVLAAALGVPALAWWIRRLLGRVNGLYQAGLDAPEQGRLRLLNQLSDATAPLVEPAEMRRVSCELLGRHLQASRCLYAEIAADPDRFEIADDYTDGCGSLTGEHGMDVFGAAGTATLREGRGLWVRDAASELTPEVAARFAAHGVKSAFVGPVMKSGHLQALIVVQDKEIRTWSDADASLVCEVGERCRTIIGRARAEAELRRARDALERANRAKDDFLAALSHELRTPLTPVLVSAAALREDDRLPAETRAQLGMMERNIALEARLIDDLLDLTKISRGKLQLRLKLSDAHALIRLAIEIVGPEAQAKGITIATNFAAESSGLRVDPERFQQVVWNLVRNAVKFTPAGGRIAISTRAQTWPDGSLGLHLEVSDSGIGIEPGMLDRIFLPFDQGALTDQHRFGGIGLGLAIARTVVELHGGRIRASSAGANCGATFTVELPGAVAAPVVATETGRAPGSGRSEGTPATPLRLLLVEDHESTLQALVRLLKRDGHEVKTASTAEAALQAAAGGPCDLVISDLGLPDGSGLELMHQLRTTYGLEGIALSGYGMGADRARSRAAGFVAHLVKPVNIGELRKAVADAVAHRVAAG